MVTVRFPAAAGSPPRSDRHLTARVDEPPRVRHLADVLHGTGPEPADDLWRRHPGCAVLAVPGPDGTVVVRVRGRDAPLLFRVSGGRTDAAALVGSLVHALLSLGPAIRR
ncbi:hypothetical protein AMK19_19635 [Kitasatospora sp. CB01950]|nr:hypothetical protein AMK19_19635 [Kitasatospora sp. CB01950]